MMEYSCLSARRFPMTSFTRSARLPALRYFTSSGFPGSAVLITTLDGLTSPRFPNCLLAISKKFCGTRTEEIRSLKPTTLPVNRIGWPWYVTFSTMGSAITIDWVSCTRFWEGAKPKLYRSRNWLGMMSGMVVDPGSQCQSLLLTSINSSGTLSP